MLCVLTDIHLDGHKACYFHRVTVMTATIYDCSILKTPILSMWISWNSFILTVLLTHLASLSLPFPWCGVYMCSFSFIVSLLNTLILILEEEVSDESSISDLTSAFCLSEHQGPYSLLSQLMRVQNKPLSLRSPKHYLNYTLTNPCSLSFLCLPVSASLSLSFFLSFSLCFSYFKVPLWWGALYFTWICGLTVVIIVYFYTQCISINTEKTSLAVFIWHPLSLHDGDCDTVAISPKMKVSVSSERAHHFFKHGFKHAVFHVGYCALF